MKNITQPVIAVIAVAIISSITLLVIEHFTFEPPEDQFPEYKLPIAFSDSEIAELSKKFTKIKLPAEYEKEALIALAHYPELMHEKIQFLIEPALFPLASRPSLLSLIFPWTTRTYYIYISSKTIPSLKPIMLSNLPFEARIGVLGHELGHTAYYRKRSNLQIITDGFSYLLPGYRKKFETETDLRTISHGLGKQLYAWSSFLQQVLEEHPEIKSTRFIFEDRYLKPLEIETFINK